MASVLTLAAVFIAVVVPVALVLKWADDRLRAKRANKRRLER
jgi:hypothetical protein